ncbi:hypothetical protein VW29_16665 [Devosia limi DSM 17137]|nr:hypothetical protein VW29_16665 [Devosia limi DSM 17137]
MGFFGALLLGSSARSAATDHASALSLYDRPALVPERPLSVYHLGHSLVGRDMPAMLAQLAGNGHDYQSQLGWGTSLKEHWGPIEGINGFDVENDHPRYRDAASAVESGDYDSIVVTEMVEIRSAIAYHDSANYLARWAERAHSARNDVNVYLYETWPEITDPEGWLERVDLDLTRYWEQQILLPAAAKSGHPIYVIPGGQALAAVVRAVIERGGVDGVTRVEDFFALAPDGSQDAVHFNDLGAYVIALTHYAVLYQRDPSGLPYQLNKAGGSAAVSPGPALAELMQATVWRVVNAYPKTGLPNLP